MSSLVSSFFFCDEQFVKKEFFKKKKVVYGLGTALLAISAIHNSVGLMAAGLILIAIGTGGIKPCVSSFGADQLKNMPDREERFNNILFFFLHNH